MPDDLHGGEARGRFVLARVLNSSGDLDYLVAWDVDFGTTTALSLDLAMTFATAHDAEVALGNARRRTPQFMDGRAIDWRIVTLPV